MAKHWVTIRAQFDIDDEIGMRTNDSRILELSLKATDMATFENALMLRVSDVALEAWKQAGLNPGDNVATNYGDEVTRLIAESDARDFGGA